MIRAFIRDHRPEETCDLEDYEGIMVAKVYTHPDGDGIMTEDEADVQMQGLGLTRVSDWRREGDATVCDMEPCGSSEN